MRLLVLSSFYPPDYLGGYELLADASVEGLRERGHHVEILTSTFRTEHGAEEPERDGVARELHLYWNQATGWWERPGLFGSIAAAKADLAAFDRAVDRARPDTIWAWHLAAVSKTLLVRAAARDIPVVLSLLDEWPIFDHTDPWFRYTRGPMAPLGLALGAVSGLPRRPADLSRLSGASYASQWMRTKLHGGGHTPDGPVVYPGVDAARFTPGPPLPDRIRRFLHLGRVEPRKGPMVAVRALAEARGGGLDDATLTFAGPSEAGHADEVLALARELGVGDAVTYAGVVQHEAINALYHAHDAVIHSATWEEPFGLVLVEAMATGRPLLASPTGGATEIATDRANALTFPPGDASGCARRMLEMAGDPALVAGLVHEGFATAARFSRVAMIDGHERHLRETLGRD